MSRKLKAVVLGLLAVAVLASGVVIAGAVVAQDEDTPPPQGTPQEEEAAPFLMAKVAEALGIEEHQLGSTTRLGFRA